MRALIKRVPEGCVQRGIINYYICRDYFRLIVFNLKRTKKWYFRLRWPWFVWSKSQKNNRWFVTSEIQRLDSPEYSYSIFAERDCR